VTLTTETHMVGKRHQAWRNLMVAAVLMTGSPANANDRTVHAAYCEQVALELYNKFSAISPSLIPAFDPDLHAAVAKEHNEILAQITREYHRFKDYADAALTNDSRKSRSQYDRRPETPNARLASLQDIYRHTRWPLRRRKTSLRAKTTPHCRQSACVCDDVRGLTICRK